MNTQNYRAEAEDRHGLELIGDAIARLSKKSSSPLFSGIRKQLALGRLPNLAQHLAEAKSRKEVVAL